MVRAVDEVVLGRARQAPPHGLGGFSDSILIAKALRADTTRLRPAAADFVRDPRIRAVMIAAPAGGFAFTDPGRGAAFKAMVCMKVFRGLAAAGAREGRHPPPMSGPPAPLGMATSMNPAVTPSGAPLDPREPPRTPLL